MLQTQGATTQPQVGQSRLTENFKFDSIFLGLFDFDMIINSAASKHVAVMSWTRVVKQHRFSEIPESCFIDNLKEIFIV